MSIKTVYGKDSAGNKAFIQVSKKNGSICIFSSEECSDVALTTKQAKELIDSIRECIIE